MIKKIAAEFYMVMEINIFCLYVDILKHSCSEN